MEIVGHLFENYVLYLSIVCYRPFAFPIYVIGMQKGIELHVCFFFLLPDENWIFNALLLSDVECDVN